MLPWEPSYSSLNFRLEGRKLMPVLHFIVARLVNIPRPNVFLMFPWMSPYNGPVTTPWQLGEAVTENWVLFCSDHSFDNSIISHWEPPQSRPPPISPPESEAGNSEGHRRQQNLSVQLRKLLSPWRILHSCKLAILQSTAEIWETTISLSFCDVFN